MKRIRVIPVLLLNNEGLVKSVKFKNYIYIGDPINAVKIFNEKEVDEIIILDIEASKNNRPPDLVKIKEIASEAFIPLAYGGGITTINQVSELFYAGVEKVVFNYAAVKNLNLIAQTAKMVGSQSVVVSIDVKKSWLGKYNIFTLNGTEMYRGDLISFAKRAVEEGAGEIFLNSIDRDGTYLGYDLELIKMVSSAVSVPVIACGGAGSVDDFRETIKSGASAVAAGSIFVLQRPHKAVLISYPSQSELEMKLYNK